MSNKQAAIDHDCKLALTYIHGVAIEDGDEMLAEAAEKLEAALQSKPVDVEGLKLCAFYQKFVDDSGEPIPNGKTYSTDQVMGWNDCIDHLHVKGYLNIV